jgi:hypothetical protein
MYLFPCFHPRGIAVAASLAGHMLRTVASRSSTTVLALWPTGLLATRQTICRATTHKDMAHARSSSSSPVSEEVGVGIDTTAAQPSVTTRVATTTTTTGIYRKFTPAEKRQFRDQRRSALRRQRKEKEGPAPVVELRTRDDGSTLRVVQPYWVWAHSTAKQHWDYLALREVLPTFFSSTPFPDYVCTCCTGQAVSL